MDVLTTVLCDWVDVHQGRLRVALAECEDGEQALITYRQCPRCGEDVPEQVDRATEIEARLAATDVGRSRRD